MRAFTTSSRLALTALLVFAGCAAPSAGNISNFAQVAAGIYRGGQPNDAGWAELRALGVTNVVKLNPETEASDVKAQVLGMHVVYLPINTFEQVAGGVPTETLDPAVAAIGPGTYVHCEHGQDRTGLIVACYRLRTGWSKPDAEKEMLTHGFHKSLLGLWLTWQSR